MRCYNWNMPEERFRTTIDHASDLMYVYLDEYKKQGIREGLNPNNIVVVGNPIVDILQKYYFEKINKYYKIANEGFFKSRNIEKDNYYIATCHRRENINEEKNLKAILKLLSDSPFSIYFPAGYRTQKILKERRIKIPKHIIMVDPIGYKELLALMVNSRGV